MVDENCEKQSYFCACSYNIKGNARRKVFLGWANCDEEQVMLNIYIYIHIHICKVVNDIWGK